MTCFALRVSEKNSCFLQTKLLWDPRGRSFHSKWGNSFVQCVLFLAQKLHVKIPTPSPEVVGLREKKPEVALSRPGGTVRHGPFQGSVPNFGLVIVSSFSLRRAPPPNR